MLLQVSQVAELSAKKLGVGFKNGHVSVSGRAIVDPAGAKEI